jgi:hypothetical protein
MLLAACAPLAAPTPTSLPTTAPKPVILTNGPLVLKLLAPADETVVAAPQVNVVGEVSAETVLTINDEIYLLPAGAFSQAVPLEEGPNVLEIVASDAAGNEVYLILTVTYQP